MTQVPPSNPSAGRNHALLWALFAGFVVALVAVCGVLVLASTGEGSQEGSREGTKDAAASEVVTEYMDALTEGDASTAIDLVKASGVETVLSEEA